MFKTRFLATFMILLVIVTLALIAIAPKVKAATEISAAPGMTVIVPQEEPTQPAVPESVLLIVPILVGSIGVPVINWAKKQFGWTKPEDKVKNLWLSFGISLSLAIIALALTSSVTPMVGPESVVTWITLVFSVATLIYKSMRAAKPESITPVQ